MPGTTTFLYRGFIERLRFFCDNKLQLDYLLTKNEPLQPVKEEGVCKDSIKLYYQAAFIA